MKSKILWFIVAVLAVPSIIFLGLISPFFFSGFLPNYAQEAAKPLEDALIKAGAVKNCSTGDSGRGLDNDEPNYGAIYEIKRSPEDTIGLVNKIASENGYNLTDHTHLINAGVNKLYVDESRKSPYPELEDDNLMVGFHIYKDKIYAPGQFCGVKEGGDLSSTTVSISVSLPAFKR